MRQLLPRQRVALAIFIAFTVGTVGAAFAGQENSGNPKVTLNVSPTDGDNLPSPASISVTGAGFGTSAIQGDILECSFQTASQVDICSEPLGRFTADPAGNFTTTVNVTSTFTGPAPTNTPVNCAVTPCTVQAVSDSGAFKSAHHISFGTGNTSSTTTSTVPVTTSTSTSTTSTVPVTSTSTSTSTTSTVPVTSTSSTSTTSTVPVTSTSSTSTSVPSVTTTTLSGSQCAQLQAIQAQFNSQINAIEASIIQSLPADLRPVILAQLEAARAQGDAQISQALASSNCAAPF